MTPDIISSIHVSGEQPITTVSYVQIENRFVRSTVILLKEETEYGVDAEPSSATDALLISDAAIETNFTMVDRNVLRQYFGASDQACGSSHVKISFSVELSAAGTKGATPAWDTVLRCCGWGKVTTANDVFDADDTDKIISHKRIEYVPRTTDMISATIYYYDAGVLHCVTGFRGQAKLNLKIDERPVLQIEGLGLNDSIMAKAVPNPTLTNWHKPPAITNNSTQSLRFDCKYDGGEIKGGVKYKSRGLELDCGEKAEAIHFLGGSQVEITDRNITGNCELFISGGTEALIYDMISNDTLRSLGFIMGTEDGERVIIYAPLVQMTNPKSGDQQGLRMLKVDLRCLPVEGNDDLTICIR